MVLSYLVIILILRIQDSRNSNANLVLNKNIFI